MRTPKLLTALITFASMCCGVAQASPLIDQLNVQGYMKKANNTAVSDGTYNMAFGVFQNGVALWGRQYSVTVTGGLFSQTLSGAGTNLAALGAGTGMNSNWTAVTLNPALLVGGASGEVMVRVYAVAAIDGSNPQFDISLGAVPTAFVAGQALTVVPGGVSLAMLEAAAKTASSAGAGDSGKIPLLDGSGLLDVTFIPSIPASKIGSGSVGLANGGTGGTDAATGRAGLGAAASGTNADITELTGLTTALSVAQGGTGATTASAARSNLSAAVTGANGDITSLTAVTSVASSAGLTLSSAAAGTTTLGDNTGAATTAIRSGTGGITVGVTGTTGNVVVTPGSTSGTYSGTKSYSGGVQTISALVGTNQTLALDGSEIVMLTATSAAAATTVQTVTGCNSGLYPTGAKVTIIVAGNSGAGTIGFVDTTVATATPDLMTLSAAANLVSGAGNGVGRGTSLTLACVNILGVKKWVEVARSANTN